jgi:serine acetyltransferase
MCMHAQTAHTLGTPTCAGDHAVVGLGSVVTINVAAYAIVAGNPARVIGDRRHARGLGGATLASSGSRTMLPFVAPD